MLIILSKESTLDNINYIKNKLEEYDLATHIINHNGYPLIITNNNSLINSELISLEALSFVEKIAPIDKPYTLASREYKKDNTLVNVQNCIFGGDVLQIIAGPCAVENEEQVINTAIAVKKAGATLLRGGVYKPRTSPYSFQGLGIEGLNLLKKAGEIAKLPIVTEVMDINDIEVVSQIADLIQIGSRNMHNYSLLKELAGINKPILLKRGFASTIEEWLLAAEYLLAGGNSQVILCERGIRTFETSTRNTLDLTAVPLIKELSHLPIIVDPSHGTGKWSLVSAMARAAVAAGVHGLMIEVHPNPSSAFSDGEQSLTYTNFANLMKDVKKIHKVMQ